MLSRILLPAMAAGILAASMASAANRSGFELLTDQEYQSEVALRSAAPGAALIPKAADFDAPIITVLKPDRTTPVQPPFDIDVRFKAAEGASVNLASLKVMYGFLRLDVTKRILMAPGVQVSEAGLTASGAQMPSGSHKVVIELADNFGRKRRQLFEFTVL
jgi:hypothetical protein